MDVTTVADDLIVAHDGANVIRMQGLSAATEYAVGGATVTTLTSPAGALLSRFATVNDLHFGELRCGEMDHSDRGPIERAADGEPPYPVTMNSGAVEEMLACDGERTPLAAVVVKGDLSLDGAAEEWAEFERCYRRGFGERLHVVRGNHDAYHGQATYAGDQWIEVPGAAIALMDTVIPGSDTGTLRPQQLEWLDDLVAGCAVPVLVMGHHQQWVEGKRSDGYFGLHPDASEALNALADRRRNVLAYTAGHTHRHRVRTMSCGVVTVEVGCTKDFPGTWAEYRVHEGGIMQVVHRVSTPAALSWSERCRHLYRDFGVDYEAYALGRLEDRCFTIGLR